MKFHYYSRQYQTWYLCRSQLIESGLETANRMLSTQEHFWFWTFDGFIGLHQHQLGNFLCGVFQS